MKQLVLGWGNPMVGDDGIGIRAAELLAERIGEEIHVMASSHAGLRLVERMLGYDRVIIADVHQGDPDGGLHREVVHPRALSPLEQSVRHDGTLHEALQVMCAMNASDLPEEVVLLSTGIPAPREWRDGLSSGGESAAERLANAVMGELEVTAVV